MRSRDSSRLLALATLVVASGLLVGVGVYAGAQLAEETRKAGLRVLAEDFRDEARTAGDRVREILRASRATPVADVPIPHVVVSARYARSDARRPPTPFPTAERAEFVDNDPPRALAAYREALDDPDLDASWRAEGLRNVARLERTSGELDRARRTLEEARRVDGADDHTALLVAYDAARCAEGDAARSRLRAALADGAYPAATPAVRHRLFERLGAPPEAAPGLRALAAALDVASPTESLIALPDGRVAWSLDQHESAYRFAVASLEDVLRATLPGYAAGRWRHAESGGVNLPRPPFPPTPVVPGPTPLTAIDRQASGRRWIVLAPSLALAALLAFAAVAIEREDRRRRAQAERSEAFLLSATHELKTPIANVRLYAETLAAHGAEDPNAIARFANIIDAEARRLERRVHDMLVVAAGNERRSAPTTSFDPVPIVEQLVRAWQGREAAPPLHLDVTLAEGTRARGTGPLFASALEAVLDNAVKFGSAHEIAVRIVGDTRSVEVDVEDRGPGIPPADLERVFEPLERLSRDVAAARPGTGLGLALARRCARACGGDVIAEAPPEGGTRLRVLIPRAPDAEETPSCPTS